PPLLSNATQCTSNDVKRVNDTSTNMPIHNAKKEDIRRSSHVLSMRKSQERIRSKWFIVHQETGLFHALDFVGNEGGKPWSHDMRNIRHLRRASESHFND